MAKKHPWGMVALLSLFIISVFLVKAALRAPRTTVPADSAGQLAAGAPAGAAHYQERRGFEYLYKGESGRQTTVAFLGKRGGIYQLMSRQGPVLTVWECHAPCASFTLYTSSGRTHVRASEVEVKAGSIEQAIAEDARNGRLDPYVLRQGGKPHYLWFEQKTQPLLLPAA